MLPEDLKAHDALVQYLVDPAPIIGKIGELNYTRQ
jgi:hypothetical protein